MIWLLVVPAVWTVMALLVGVFVGQCIRIQSSDAPHETLADPAAAAAVAGEPEAREAAADAPVPVGVPVAVAS